MRTPIVDFIKDYNKSKSVRFHMPGHKGKEFLGFENWDITEIKGADVLYEPDGIIAESEKNAAELFGTGKTCFSAEGSSQCIKAMLYLALNNKSKGRRPVIVAARNVHKAFVYAAALLDFETEWLWPESSPSLCRCDISAANLEKVLKRMDIPPAAVYITSPDYLGNMADIAALSQVCHRYGTILAVDNAHGAYLHFLPEKCHPIDLGADICCDSAHKTLPVITGGAYLHISRRMSEIIGRQAKTAVEMFGSTSPSYLILASLDLCNRYIYDGYGDILADRVRLIDWVRNELNSKGWHTEKSDPLRITLRAAANGSGTALAERLRKSGIECEYADRDYAVLMATPENDETDFTRLINALGENKYGMAKTESLPMAKGDRALSIREAIMSEWETIRTENAIGRICAAPAVSCPPAIPIAVSGEKITEEAVWLFKRYDIDRVNVVKE